MEDEDDYAIQGLPGLARLPLLGYLFGYRQKTEGRRELVVLLTPHIWSADQVMAHGPAPIMGGHTLDDTKWAGPATTTGASATPGNGASALTASLPAGSVIARAEPEVALTAGDSSSKPAHQAQVPAQAASLAAANGTNPKDRTRDAPSPKRGFFRSLFDRRTRRSDSESVSVPKRRQRASIPARLVIPTPAQQLPPWPRLLQQ